MIKTKINEGRFTDAIGRSVQSLKAQLPKSKVEKEQPQQQIVQKEEPKEQEITSVPNNWKPEKGTTIKLKNKNDQLINYRVSNKGNWVGPDNNPVRKDLIPILNLEAYKLSLKSNHNPISNQSTTVKETDIDKLHNSFNNLKTLINNLYWLEHNKKYYFYYPTNNKTEYSKIIHFGIDPYSDTYGLDLATGMLIYDYRNSKGQIDINNNIAPVGDEFKKPFLNFLNVNKKEILEKSAKFLRIDLENNDDKTQLSESLLIRWKQLAGIRG